MDQSPTLADLMPRLHSLTRAEKLEAIQLLARDLAGSEGQPGLLAGQAYPVWSPIDAHDAAATLSDMLDQDRGSP
jgi:hypothetical protein